MSSRAGKTVHSSQVILNETFGVLPRLDAVLASLGPESWMRRRLVGLLAFAEHTLVPGGHKAVVGAYLLGPWRYKSSSRYRTERGNAGEYANTEAESSEHEAPCGDEHNQAANGNKLTATGIGGKAARGGAEGRSCGDGTIPALAIPSRD